MANSLWGFQRRNCDTKSARAQSGETTTIPEQISGRSAA
jgi:hypothetical protein